MTARVIAILLMVSTAAADNPQSSGQAKKEFKQLQGIWKVVKLVKGGKIVPAEQVARTRVTIASDELIFKGLFFEEEAREARLPITLDPTRKPATIDLHLHLWAGHPLRPVKFTFLGIYELDGDTLRICFRLEGAERPTVFVSREDGEDTVLLVLQRQKE